MKLTHAHCRTTVKSERFCFGGNPLQNVLGSLGGLQSSIQTEWKKQEKDFQQFGKDVCSRVVTLEDSRKALVGNLK
ncbi:TPA: hypothetical protein RKY06_004760 [Escherichia coli]|nr:hypothetical protein [Escherichia coli]